ncbi:hypothetical protein PCE1_000460 [Barthelona sp. PCE]
MNDSNIGLFESPTGTGKSIAVAVAIESFLRSNLYLNAVSPTTNSTGLPSWIPKKHSEIQAELINEQNSEHQSHVNLLKDGVLPDIEDVGRITHPVVIFSTRTHTQLAQMAGELEKTCPTRLSVVVSSRKKVCIHPELSSNPCLDELCPKSHCKFRKDVEGLMMTLAHTCIGADEQKQQGMAMKECPYYAIRRLLRFADIILMPYPLLFMDCWASEPHLIIDEGHNMPDAANSLLSASVSIIMFDRAVECVNTYIKRYMRVLGSDKLVKLRDFASILTKISSFTECSSLRQLSSRIDPHGFPALFFFIYEEKLQHKMHINKNDENPIVECLRFLQKLQKSFSYKSLIDTVFLSRDENTIHLFCCNPFPLLNRTLDNYKSASLVGGTMEPFDYFSEFLTFQSSYVAPHVIAPSQFRCFLVEKLASNFFDFSFAFRDKSVKCLQRALPLITRVAPNKGGIVVFFPSKKVEDLFHCGLPDVGCTVFRSENFDDFSNATMEGKAVLTAVIGGRYSEGVDFKDDIARIVIIAGLPFPNPHVNPTRLRLATGGQEEWRLIEVETMRKVNQCIGRVIRHSRDYGVALLLDHRFGRLNHLLSEWIRTSYQVKGFPQALSDTKRFFQ